MANLNDIIIDEVDLNINVNPQPNDTYLVTSDIIKTSADMVDGLHADDNSVDINDTTLVTKNKVKTYVDNIIHNIGQNADTVDGLHANTNSITDDDNTLATKNRIIEYVRDQINLELQVNCNDNFTTVINVADITLHRTSYIDYTIQDENLTSFEAGKIMILHNGTQTNIDVSRFGLIGGLPSEMASIEYTSDIDVNNLRLKITATLVGSNLKFKYTNKQIALAV
jgi:hypothetical protein